MNTINISGQQITWSFVQLVRKKCNLDWDITMDVFWKARKAAGGPQGIMKYIMAGFRKQWGGAVPYILQPSPEREDGRMETIRQWWLGDVYQTKNKVMSMKEIFAAIAAGEEK